MKNTEITYRTNAIESGRLLPLVNKISQLGFSIVLLIVILGINPFLAPIFLLASIYFFVSIYIHKAEYTINEKRIEQILIPYNSKFSLVKPKKKILNGPK